MGFPLKKQHVCNYKNPKIPVPSIGISSSGPHICSFCELWDRVTVFRIAFQVSLLNSIREVILPVFPTSTEELAKRSNSNCQWCQSRLQNILAENARIRHNFSLLFPNCIVIAS